MKRKFLAIVFLLNFTSFLSLNAQWAKTYGGSEDDCPYSIQQTSDGGYIVAGMTWSYGKESRDLWVLKLTFEGDIEWQKTYGGALGEEAYSIQQTNDGGYIVAGCTDSYGAGKHDFLIIKLSSNGDIDSSCEFVKVSNAEVSDAGISPANTYIDPEDINIASEDTNITPQESEAIVYSLCTGQHTLSLHATPGGTTDPQPGTYIYDRGHQTSLLLENI